MNEPRGGFRTARMITYRRVATIQPSVTGVEGVVRSDDLLILQCQECGLCATGAHGVTLTTSGIRHHRAPWPDGRTDNPRLCRSCRLARGCQCVDCDGERRSFTEAEEDAR